MLKNLAVGWMLTVSVAQGVTPALPSIMPISSAAAARAAVAPVTSLQVTAPVESVALSRSEMSEVRGSGFFSWIKKALSIVNVIAKVLGAIIAVFELFRSKTETTTSSVAGGETVQRNESETQDYASHAAYQAGTPSTVSNYATNSWQQTEVWYGGGGCASGDGGGRFYEREMVMEPSC